VRADLSGPYWVNHTTWACRRHVPSAKYHANAEQCLLGCPNIVRPPLQNRPAAPEAVAPPEPPVLPTPIPQVSRDPEPPQESWRGFGQLDPGVLAEQSLDHLRKYAANVLQIAGASKIRGGKTALLEVILDHRKAA